jgi:CRISPR type IV-associated protein Csf1
MTPTVPEMVCRALGVPPYSGEIAKEETRCSFCGKLIAMGDPCKHKALSSLGEGFTNDASLAFRTNIACQWCPPLMKKDLLFKTPNTVVTLDGLFSLTRDDYRTWFFLTPPVPPWAAFFVTTNMAHVAWRTPLTLDNKLMAFRLDEQIMHIRHDLLLMAVNDCKRAGVLLADAASNGDTQLGKAKKKPEQQFIRNHPFIALDREASKMMHGQLLPQFLKLADDNKEARAIADRLTTLTKGELIALATLVKAKPVDPVQPERISL